MSGVTTDKLREMYDLNTYKYTIQNCSGLDDGPPDYALHMCLGRAFELCLYNETMKGYNETLRSEAFNQTAVWQKCVGNPDKYKYPFWEVHAMFPDHGFPKDGYSGELENGHKCWTGYEAEDLLGSGPATVDTRNFNTPFIIFAKCPSDNVFDEQSYNENGHQEIQYHPYACEGANDYDELGGIRHPKYTLTLIIKAVEQEQGEPTCASIRDEYGSGSFEFGYCDPNRKPWIAANSTLNKYNSTLGLSISDNLLISVPNIELMIGTGALTYEQTEEGISKRNNWRYFVKYTLGYDDVHAFKVEEGRRFREFIAGTTGVCFGWQFEWDGDTFRRTEHSPLHLNVFQDKMPLELARQVWGWDGNPFKGPSYGWYDHYWPAGNQTNAGYDSYDYLYKGQENYVDTHTAHSKMMSHKNGATTTGSKVKLTCRVANDLTIVESVPPQHATRSPLATSTLRQLYSYAKGGPFAVEEDYNKIVVECPAKTIAVGCGCSGYECVQQLYGERHSTVRVGSGISYCNHKCSRAKKEWPSAYNRNKNCLKDCGAKCLGDLTQDSCSTWSEEPKAGLCEGKTDDDVMVTEMCPWGLGNEINGRNDKTARPPCRLGEGGEFITWRMYGTEMPDGTEGNVSDPFDGARCCELTCEEIGGPCTDWVYEASLGYNFDPSPDRTGCEYTWPDVVDRHLPITLLAYCVEINKKLTKEALDLSETLNGVFNAARQGASEPELTETDKKIDVLVEDALQDAAEESSQPGATSSGDDDATVIFNTIDATDLVDSEKANQMKRKMAGNKKIKRINRGGDLDGSRRVRSTQTFVR